MNLDDLAKLEAEAKRTHIAKRPVEIVRATPLAKQRVDSKPKGFWYSVDGGWEEWCRSEMPSWIEGCASYEVLLSGENILKLRTVTDIDLFHEEFKAPLAGMKPEKHFMYIDWKRVAGHFDGIEIAPYCWKRWLDGDAHYWYYGWDCASGCVWTPRGMRVRALKELEEVKNA